MPLREYICDNCQAELTELQGLHDKPLRKCPSCKKLKLRKLFSVPSIKVVGGGRTFGSIADDNAKRLTQHQKDKLALEASLHRKVADADVEILKKENKSIVGDIAKRNKIAKLDDKGKQKYVQTGKL